MADNRSSCLWCGGRWEYTCLIRRRREPSFRSAIGFHLCMDHGAEAIEHVAKLATADELTYLRWSFPHLAL
jgi:hypothetical protein